MIAPIALLGAGKALNIIQDIFSPSKPQNSQAFEAAMKKQNAFNIQLKKAEALIGHEVKVEDARGWTLEGKVEGVEKTEQGPMLVIDGKRFYLGDVKEILANKGETV